LGFLEYLITDQGVECARGDQVDGSAEHGCQFLAQVLDRPSQASAGSEGVEQIDVALGAGGAACQGPEDLKTHDAVALAHFAQALAVDLHREHGCSLRGPPIGASGPGAASWQPASQLAYTLLVATIGAFALLALAVWGIPGLSAAWPVIAILAAALSTVLLVLFWNWQLTLGIVINAGLVAAAAARLSGLAFTST
jgi:hypothetical protein